MHRLTTVLTLIAIISIGAVPDGTAASRPTQRTVTEDYECPCGASAAHQSWSVTFEDHNAATFETKRGDRYLQVTVDDDVAQAVHARVMQDTDPGDLDYELWLHICTQTTEPIEITPGVDVHIDVLTGTCDDQETPSSPTRGVIAATFSNVP